MAQTSTSTIERHFLINNVYKRSRRYFDIMKLNQLEHQQELQRRSPQRSKETIHSRVGESFVCSSDLLHHKVGNDLDYFGSRKGEEDMDEVETTITTVTRKSRTVDMKKMLNWSDFDHQKPKYRNQEQFNNFTLKKHVARNSFDFDRYPGRAQPKSERIEIVNPEKEFSEEKKVGKIREKMLYNTANARCFVDYHRYSKHQVRDKIDEIPVYEPTRVKKGDSLTKRNAGNVQGEFYHGYGKADPAQLDNRLLKDSEYFWRNSSDKSKFKDFSVVKRKEIEVLGRVNRIMDRKRLPNNKKEMCDDKYFRREPLDL